MFVSEVSEADLRREKAAARKIRHSQWWKDKISKGRCYYCSRSIPSVELTMDHLVPIIRGGRSVKGNLVAACKECNTKKQHRLPSEWDDYLQTLCRNTED